MGKWLLLHKKCPEFSRGLRGRNLLFPKESADFDREVEKRVQHG